MWLPGRREQKGVASFQWFGPGGPQRPGGGRERDANGKAVIPIRWGRDAGFGQKTHSTGHLTRVVEYVPKTGGTYMLFIVEIILDDNLGEQMNNMRVWLDHKHFGAVAFRRSSSSGWHVDFESEGEAGLFSSDQVMG
jgi:hypothetical protein